MRNVKVSGRAIQNLIGLREDLLSKGFQVEGLAVDNNGGQPYICVCMADGDPKDPTLAVLSWTDPDSLRVTSNQPSLFDGIAFAPADGTSVHRLTIQKVDATGAPVAGSEGIRLMPSQLIGVAPASLLLVNGVAHALVGPSTMVGEVSVRVQAQAGNLKEASIKLRFV